MIYETARYITPPPYTDASLVEGMDADGNLESVRLDHTLFRQPEHGPLGFIESGGVIGEYEPPAPPATRIFKSVIIRRLTETEAATWEAALQAAPAKMRLFFNSLEYFVSDDPDYPTLVGAMMQAFGEERTAQLLALD